MMSILPKTRFDLKVSPAIRSGIMDISSLKWSSFAEEEVVLFEGKKVPIWFVLLRSPPHSLLEGNSGFNFIHFPSCCSISWYLRLQLRLCFTLCVCLQLLLKLSLCLFYHFAKVDQKCTSPLQVGSQLDFVLSFKDPLEQQRKENICLVYSSHADWRLWIVGRRSAENSSDLD